MNVTRLRPARTSDRSAVQDLIVSERLLLEGVDESFGEAWVVAVRGDRVVGCAGVESHGGHGVLRSVAVAVDERGSGLGRRLVENRVAWARERGLETLSLLTLTAADFFAHLGFREVPREDVPAAARVSGEFTHTDCVTARAFLRRLD
jgi:amino-acid N-acetyltransferase